MCSALASRTEPSSRKARGQEASSFAEVTESRLGDKQLQRQQFNCLAHCRVDEQGLRGVRQFRGKFRRELMHGQHADAGQVPVAFQMDKHLILSMRC